MFTVLRNTWLLLLGLLFLMLGNGLQGTLLGIRGKLEGFSTGALSVVMSGYFVGFLVASRLAPVMIRRVGHVRVFAALGSFISAVLILFPVVPEPWAWTVLRAILGFCYCGVYITVESWLNDASTNETRGQAMSLYLIVQMVGIISAQALMNLGNPAGFLLFVIPSVLVSVAFAPILLSVSPAPAFQATKPMRLRSLYQVSPLGCIGMFLLGGIFACMFGMSAVFGAEAGLSVKQITLFVSAIYVGGMLFQYPVGWLSDRMDRRRLIVIMAAIGAVSAGVGMVRADSFALLLVVGFGIGAVANPLYGLLVAYTDDFLEKDDMAAASAGLLFINGLGAIAGPLVVGWLMGVVGPRGFFLFQGVLLGVMSLHALWQMTRRSAVAVDETSAYVQILPTTSPVAMEVAQEEAWQEDDTDAATVGG